MAKKTFLVDVDKCTGCNLCVVACKDEHVDAEYKPWSKPQPVTGQFWIDVKVLERGHIPRVKVSYLPVLCQHCENAPCIKACPEGAIKRRDDGLVWIDAARCTGCGLCAPACPYDVIFMNEGLNIAQKCTGCAHRVDEGLQPRCADVCPHEAIVFADEGAPAITAAASGRPLEIFHPEYQAAPRVVWTGLPRPWITGAIVDRTADEMITDASVTVIDLFAAGASTVRSDAFGTFWVRNLEKDRKYRVEVKKPGYKDFLAVVTTDGDQDLGMIALEKR